MRENNKILILVNKQMSSRSYDFTGLSRAGSPPLRGGEGGNTSVIVLTVAVIVLIVVVLACVLCNMASPTSTGGVASTSLGARISRVFKRKPAKKALGANARNAKLSPSAIKRHAARAAINNKRVPGQQSHRARANGRRRYAGAVANPAAMPQYAPNYVPPAPLPASQLMVQNDMPEMDDALSFTVSASNAIGDSEMDRATTEVGGNSSNSYMDSSYTMDQGMMTPPSETDIQGLETFMPMMSDGVGQANGPVDPSTGLPLFTTGKLMRSQLLGGHGAGSFLRQQQDPLSGYSRLGKNMCGAQNARRDLAVRRAQFNEARLADPNGDPVLFQTSEFAYY